MSTGTITFHAERKSVAKERTCFDSCVRKNANDGTRQSTQEQPLTTCQESAVQLKAQGKQVSVVA